MSAQQTHAPADLFPGIEPEVWKIKVSAFARIRTLVAQPIAYSLYSLRHTGENIYNYSDLLQGFVCCFV